MIRVMSTKQLREKIGWKPRQRVLMIGEPKGVTDPFTGVEHVRLPVGAALFKGLKFDLILAFVADQSALCVVSPVVLGAATRASTIWIGYPKRSSGVKTDLTRDEGWDVMLEAGWTVVAIVSVNETWSAVRFRPAELVQSIRY